MDWQMIWQQIEPYKFWLVGLLAFCILWWIVTAFLMKKKKNDNARFLAENPTAATIYFKGRSSITSEKIVVYTVNGENARTFYKRGKEGVYLLPGQSVLELSYTYQRPGVMHKTVTETTDVVKKTVEVESRQTYLLSFDRKAAVFELTKYNEE